MEGIFTRSRSDIYFHRNRSGRARSDSTRFGPSDPNFKKLCPILKKRKQPDLDVSRNLRVRRVFSPSSVTLENGENPSLGSPGNDCIGAVSEDSEKGEGDCGLKRKVETSRENDQPSVKFIRPNESSSANRMVVKPGLLRKVFKSSSSFSCRRLLPFLMGFGKDYPGASDIGIDGTGSELAAQSMNNVKSNSLPDMSNCDAFVNGPVVVQSGDVKPLQSGETDKVAIESPCKQHEQSSDNLLSSPTEVNVGSCSVENTVLDNIQNGIDDASGDKITMTPPDSNIFSKFHVNNFKSSTDQGAEQIKNKFLGNPLNRKPRNDNTSTWKNSSERNGGSWKSNMVLNPCSRKKVHKLPSSVSYRRLLPYLMDVAKDSTDKQNPLEPKDSNPSDSQISTDNNASEALTSNSLVEMSSSVSESSIRKPVIAQSDEITDPNISFSLEMDGEPQTKHILSDNRNVFEPDLSNNVKKTNHGELNCGEVPSSPTTNAEFALPKVAEMSQLEATNSEAEGTLTISNDNKCADERDSSNEVQSNDISSAGVYDFAPTEALLKEIDVLMETEHMGGCGNLVKENTLNESSVPFEDSNLPVFDSVGCAETLMNNSELATIQPNSVVKENTLDESSIPFEESNLAVLLSVNCVETLMNDCELATIQPKSVVKENTSDESSIPFEESNLAVLHSVNCGETLMNDCELATIQPKSAVKENTSDESSTPIEESNNSVVCAIDCGETLVNDHSLATTQPVLVKDNCLDESSTPVEESNPPVAHTVGSGKTLMNDCKVETIQPKLKKENTSDERFTPIEGSNPSVQAVGCAETLLEDSNLVTIKPKHLEKHDINSGALVQSVNFDKYPSEIQASNCSVTQSEGTLKGILKRNPRGCRGRCDCLNCASFRLHAERAFEFSKHQMQDAEEVAVELIKELSNIRKLLENSVSDENTLASSKATQVKEACTKALQAEQVAKERIGQMNNELHHHCRIPSLQLPRVTFSVSTADLSDSPKSRKDNKKLRNRKLRTSK